MLYLSFTQTAQLLDRDLHYSGQQKQKSKFSFKLTSYSKNVTFLFALIKKFFVKATRFLQTDVTNKINGDEVISLQTGLP